MHSETSQALRILAMKDYLEQGKIINKEEYCAHFFISLKTFERDLATLRSHYSESYDFSLQKEIYYNRRKEGYELSVENLSSLTSKEILAMCKILLESRAFCKEELNMYLTKFLPLVPQQDKEIVKKMLDNEHFHYVELLHGKKLIDAIWDFSLYIHKHNIVSIDYVTQNEKHNSYRVNPVAIMFSEYYFYLVAFLTDKKLEYPTVFRLDRIIHWDCTDETFYIPDKNRFQEGEFRKRVQFMYSGELKTIRFWFSGPSLEAIRDRLPTARIIEKTEKGILLQVETYGDGINMWLRTQGEWVEFEKS